MRSNLTRRHRRRLEGLAASAVLAALLIVGSAGGAKSATVAVPAGFQETTAFSGLTNPTVVRFASDNRVFVAEKSGVIKVFDNLSDPTPTLFTDLSTTDGTPNNVLATRVHNFWDRGLLGMALHPNFPTTPYVYVLYTHDAAIGGTAPRWGTAGGVSDGCPTPPGATSDGCVVSGRLSRLQAAGNVMTGSEQVLIEDWCQQYPSRPLGRPRVRRGRRPLHDRGGRRQLSPSSTTGRRGIRSTPAATRPAAWGAELSPADARRAAALRSQDLRTSGDPSPSTERSSASIPRPAPASPQPTRGDGRRERAPHRRARLPQPLPHHHPSGYERRLAGRRRWR